MSGSGPASGSGCTRCCLPSCARRGARVVAGGRGLQSCAGEKGGSATGPSPVDRARNGSKHHLLVDATGIPLAWTVTGGNRNDVTQLVPLVERVPPVRGKVGRPRRRPDRVTADRGYDHDKYRRELRAATDQTGDRPPPDRARLRARPRPLGRRAHLRLAPPLQAAARPLRPPPRDPRSLPRARLLPRLLQEAAAVILRRVLSPLRFPSHERDSPALRASGTDATEGRECAGSCVTAHSPVRAFAVFCG